jgi:S-adenosylmethionine synthetase
MRFSLASTTACGLQTGVGSRVPIGGGAIYGKHPTHVDRFGARVARELALEAVKRGAGECLVRAVYAPNIAEPLDVQVNVSRGCKANLAWAETRHASLA